MEGKKNKSWNNCLFFFCNQYLAFFNSCFELQWRSLLLIWLFLPIIVFLMNTNDKKCSWQSKNKKIWESFCNFFWVSQKSLFAYILPFFKHGWWWKHSNPLLRKEGHRYSKNFSSAAARAVTVLTRLPFIVHFATLFCAATATRASTP